MRKINKLSLFTIITMLISIGSVHATTGIVNVNDSLTLRSGASASSTVITKFYNGTELNILNQNAGTGNGCNDNWYQVSYGGYTGYSCGTYINLKSSDNSYSNDNYNTTGGDGKIMCYEDTGALSLRSSANGSKTSSKVNCGDTVNIESTTETSGECKYWYKVNTGSSSGYVCGYFVNTTKLSSTAQKYYDNKTNGDTVSSYQAKLSSLGFPSSYYSYFLELHARHPKWNFVAEKINLNFSDAVNGENGNGTSLLQGSAFDQGYYSMGSNTYNILTDTFYGYQSEPGYYNASQEAIAYYMDPRNYLNEKYIFGFETLGYSSNQNETVVSSILGNQSFWSTPYNSELVKAALNSGVSAVHIASRIKQEVGGLTNTDSRLGGSFTYNGNSYSGYYNFFNIKSSCTNCSSIYSGYAYENGWNTPYKGLFGGANLLGKNYISLNQDTIYYEKFDVSTNDGNYTHQYQQNLAAVAQEGGITYKGYVNGLVSYLDTAITFVIPVYNNMPNNAVTAPSLGNPNNYLKNLTVDGSQVSNFTYDTYNYKVYLDSGVSSVNIGSTTINGNAKVSGTGKINISSKSQTNEITVTAQNGKTRKYTITFERKDSDHASITEAMNNSGFKYNSNYLFGINVGTNVSQLIGNITSYNNTVSVSIKSSAGENKSNDSFRTGDKITVTGKDGSKTYTAVIYGDVNGDGVITAVDYMKIKNYIMKTSSLSNENLQAADANKDGNVSAVDYMKIKNYIMGTGNIEQ